MGIHDRDYYRKPASSSFGELFGGHSAAGILVMIGAAVFLLEVATKHAGQNLRVNLLSLLYGPFTSQMVFSADAIREGEVWRLFTGFFLHNPEGIIPVVCNLLTLWWAGRELCTIYGDREFMANYLVLGIASSLAAFTYCLLRNQDAVIFNSTAPVVGVLTLFALHFPRQKVLLMFILPTPIWVCIGLIVAKDYFQASHGFAAVDAVADGVAMTFAILYHRYHWRIFSLFRSFSASRRAVQPPKLRVYREREPATRKHELLLLDAPPETEPTPKSIPDEQLEARLDSVLDKVQKEGQASLTESERELLFRASEIYRKRRANASK